MRTGSRAIFSCARTSYVRATIMMALINFTGTDSRIVLYPKTTLRNSATAAVVEAGQRIKKRPGPPSDPRAFIAVPRSSSYDTRFGLNFFPGKWPEPDARRVIYFLSSSQMRHDRDPKNEL